VAAAFIEVEKGWSVTEDEIIKFCDGRVARFKIPRHVRFVQAGDWPMSATKVNKVALREQIRHELEVAQHEPV
jgi:acyl-CoA synthetase (AMP-forming)/AMP-acid ligase II